MSKVQRIPLDPYPGTLIFSWTKKGYAKAHKKHFGVKNRPSSDSEGITSYGRNKYDDYVYVVWAEDHEAVIHEMSHVVLAVFDRCNINPLAAEGEPFCYMLTYLIGSLEGR